MAARVKGRTIATISGTALRPGISRNRRLYTTEAISNAVRRAQERIDDGSMPMTMLTHHAADDDSTQIAGRLTSVTLAEDGSAKYTADLVSTEAGQTIAALVDNRDGQPFLRGVSIRGAWVGKVRRQAGPDGDTVETADDLELDGLDFTRKPGVLGADVDTFIPAEAASAPAETAPEGRVLIHESVQEALVTTTTEADTPKAETPVPGDGPYADPGYQADKKKRYPIDTKARAKSAWSYVNQADNARAYTAAQLKRIKQRITKALKGFGVTVATQEGWLIEPALSVTEALAECWGMDSKDAGNLYVSLTNGPTTVTVSSYSLDPHDLDAVGRAAMAGACQTLLTIDPDMDGDVDVPGELGNDTATATAAGAACPCGCGCAVPEAPGACPCECSEGQCVHCMGEDDDTTETAIVSPATQLAETAPTAAPGLADGVTQTPAPEKPAAENPTPEGGPAMAEPTTAAETAAAPAVGGVTLTDDQFQQLLGRLAPIPAVPAAAAAESAPAEAVAETTAPATPAAEVTETEDQRIARLVAEGVKAALPGAIQEHVESTGGPARKGLVQPVTESATAASGLPEGWPQKPLHQYTDEEWRAHVAPGTVGAILGARGAAPAE
ncbi:hypothetical protein STRTUCAR8_08554 [Streptomyces turgidiscabies Car8]|uniref:Uncharacterized protein n=1 Tax=Streptomyces turgidiscabies (strain Car8) TaxID=698760 RepID=L7FAI6_STRT8|nr:DUF6582 domain-containing protein [Streptomyces turgidiscabies]ELP67670.1 hypothetical protein STRTUCAR8_08554 [Streptomyces turgidiscabies Car8]